MLKNIPKINAGLFIRRKVINREQKQLTNNSTQLSILLLLQLLVLIRFDDMLDHVQLLIQLLNHQSQVFYQILTLQTKILSLLTQIIHNTHKRILSQHPLLEQLLTIVGQILLLTEKILNHLLKITTTQLQIDNLEVKHQLIRTPTPENHNQRNVSGNRQPSLLIFHDMVMSEALELA